tara:strand:- start:92 stop:2068 length:1977 start_codon:yes stop_codon:yes gene_type:complete
MSLASMIAKQVVKATGDMFNGADVQKAISAQVDDVLTSEALQGKDGQDYLVRMTKAMLNDDPNFKPDVDRDPNLGLYLEVEHKLFSGNPDMREAYYAAKINNAKLPSRNVMPAPQRFFDPEDKAFKPFLGDMGQQPGGRYLEMGAEGPTDITGEFPQRALIGVTPEGKPVMKVSKALLEGETRTDGRKIKTNLFKKKAGWRWTQVPKGFDPEPPSSFPLVSVEDGKQHYYTLQAEFPEGVELTRYEKSKSEPRLRPTKKGNVHLGKKVGEISVRGKKHPVYDKIEVYGLIGASTAGMLADEDFKDLFTESIAPKRTAIAEGGAVTRKIKSGDTLSKISKETGVSVSDLVKLNNIENPDFIRAGDTLILTDAPKKQSPIRRAAIRQTKEKPVEEEKSSFTLIPTNAKAFTRFLLGNFLGLSTEGRDIDVSTLGEEQQTVLKNAMVNARKDGRDYVTYKDYPKMADGQVVDDFYRQKRSETNIFDLAKASFTDPVFEMFTSLGAFNFREMPSGEFEVLPDRYDFDKSKSTARDRANPKDDYSKLTYLGQDISEDEDAYGFNFKGRINVAKGGKVDKKKMACNKPRRTPNHPKKSHVVKACKDGKEKIIRFGEQGAKTAGKPKAGESKRMKAKRKSFKARHRRNIKKGNMSAAYWADKVKW